MNDMKLEEDALKWVKKVGEYILANQSKASVLSTKEIPGDVVTEIDKTAEKLLRNNIEKSYPSHSIIGEEFSDKKGASDYLWTIDPIDGTTNYVRGIPYYSVSLSIEHKGTPVLGIVYAPKLKELFFANQIGAYMIDMETDEVIEISVSDKKDLLSSTVVTGLPKSKEREGDNNGKELSLAIPKIGNIRRMGSAALDLAYVASGRFDGYWELHVEPWDVKAGTFIVEKAEGTFSVKKNESDCAVYAGNVFLIEKIKESIHHT